MVCCCAGRSGAMKTLSEGKPENAGFLAVVLSETVRALQSRKGVSPQKDGFPVSEQLRRESR